VKVGLQCVQRVVKARVDLLSDLVADDADRQQVKQEHGEAREQRQVQRLTVVPHASHEPSPVSHAQIYLKQQNKPSNSLTCDNTDMGVAMWRTGVDRELSTPPTGGSVHPLNLF